MENIGLLSESKTYGIEFKKRSYILEVIYDYVYGSTEYQLSTSTMVNGSFNISEKEKASVIKYFEANN